MSNEDGARSPWATAAQSAPHDPPPAPPPPPPPLQPPRSSPDRETWASVALGMLLGGGAVLLLGALVAIIT